MPTHVSPKSKPLHSHMVIWMYNSPNFPTMIGQIIGGRVPWNSSAKKVTHPSTIMALSGLNLGVSHGDLGKAFGLKPPPLVLCILTLRREMTIYVICNCKPMRQFPIQYNDHNYLWSADNKAMYLQANLHTWPKATRKKHLGFLVIMVAVQKPWPRDIYITKEEEVTWHGVKWT
jgi:hypothetical protein